LSNLKTLYERIEADYWSMRDEWREYGFDDLMAEVEDRACDRSV